MCVKALFSTESGLKEFVPEIDADKTKVQTFSESFNNKIKQALISEKKTEFSQVCKAAARRDYRKHKMTHDSMSRDVLGVINENFLRYLSPTKLQSGYA